MPMRLFCLLSILYTLPTAGWSQKNKADDGWLTKAERTNFQETPRYEETMDFCRRVEAVSPWVRVTSFGKSPEGRDLPLVVLSKEKLFDPHSAKQSGKAIVFIQNAIHAGEMDGKDACLMLMREIAITKRLAHILDNVILLVNPIFNVDGHERFGSHNRINQNGPRETGWRTTAQNLNLNRDYLKADAPEMRSWLKMYREWLPHLLIDSHVTDGADFQYAVTYAIETDRNVAAPLRLWARDQLLPRILPRVERSGHLIAPYIFLRDEFDPSKGSFGGVAAPRFSTGYTVLQNRAGFLIETHMLKDFKTRVDATYQVLLAILEEVNSSPRVLIDAVDRADEETIESVRRGGMEVPLQFRLTDHSEPFRYRGFAWKVEKSDISGGQRILYSDDRIEVTVPRFDSLEVANAVAVPYAYIIPPQWTEVTEVLALHGVALDSLTDPVTLSIESYRFKGPKWQERPYEGRHPVSFELEVIQEDRTYQPGMIVVRMAQRAARVAVHALEPIAPDSFVRWGFFDTIFEEKEYAEHYVMENLARQMLNENPELRQEFETKLKSDSSFARDPNARLHFFYERSPYWDRSVNVYPVARVPRPIVLLTRPLKMN